MKKKLLGAVTALMILSSCATTSTIPPVDVISEQAPHDDLNNIVVPNLPELATPKADVPRDSTGKALSSSNIYRGFDYDNYTILESNEYKIRVYINTLLSIINNENTRREQNRAENAKWRQEAQDKKAKGSE